MDYTEVTIELDDTLEIAVAFDEEIGVTVNFDGDTGSDCPIIYEIDGGDSTGDDQFDHINGLLNGGGADPFD